MPNRLINEQSLYLLQHAHNPVDWYPWGDEAFKRATEEHKPVIVSIGYAACHWCHVMEHESFENEQVAAYMNEHFICIKVDREEHPDVDHIYMDAVQAIAGSGGWPLNVFVTPERIPFYGGTYFPPRPAHKRPSWMQLMQRMAQIWEGQQDEVALQAEQMLNYLKQAASSFAAGKATDMTKETCKRIAGNILKLADKENGGFGNAPKFPGTMAISFLLDNYHFTDNKEALAQALLSLDAMAGGGIYDQLGGGFARYSTDREWLAPHFEKMLYDNALLVMAYCDAYSITKSPSYKAIIEETIAFVERELKEGTGGYFCALDADSEGVEGKYYTWTWEEWVKIFGDDAGLIGAYFGVTQNGNWEGVNILHVAGTIEGVAAAFHVPVEVYRLKIEQAKKQLYDLRQRKIRPLTDDKCLLSWNALMNIALTKAASVLGNERYNTIAAAHIRWMMEAYITPQGIRHTWKCGVAKIPAKLDDLAYLVQAMLQLASATGENRWVAEAVNIMEGVIKDFEAGEDFFYFTSSAQQDIPVRKIDLYDGATPSANAVMAHNLWICGICAERADWLERSKGMMAKIASNVEKNGYSFSYWAQLIQKNIMGMKTVICAGNNAMEEGAALRGSYIPQMFLLFATKNEEQLPILKNKFSPDNFYIFVCTEQECLPPVSVVGQAVSSLTAFK